MPDTLRFFLLLTLLTSALLGRVTGQDNPRAIVMSGIVGTEPDDQESFVRLLLYANELDLVGLRSQGTSKSTRVPTSFLR